MDRNSTAIILEVKTPNGESLNTCSLTLQDPENEAVKLIEALLKEEFERPDSRIDHLSIRRTKLAFENEVLKRS